MIRSLVSQFRCLQVNSITRSPLLLQGANRFYHIQQIQDPKPELIKVESIPQSEWTPKSKRSGLIALKKGMTLVWDELGNQIPCTVLEVKDCQVTYVKTPENEGYTALQLGCVDMKPHKVTNPLLGHFESNGVNPKHKVFEFLVTPDAVIPKGTQLNAAHFVPGQYVDVTAPTIGKGFAGGMKRHGFGGLRASHGVSLTHRSIGSTGAREGKVPKGKKMPGRMGGENATTLNLRVVKVDTQLNLIYVKGAVPGHDEQYIKVRDAVKKVGFNKFPKDTKIPFPTVDPIVLSSFPREISAKLSDKVFVQNDKNKK